MINLKTFSRHTLATALAFFVAVTLAGQTKAGRELVSFSENFAEGVHYATVNRGNIREEIFTNRQTIEPIKNGQPIPSWTVIMGMDGARLGRAVPAG